MMVEFDGIPMSGEEALVKAVRANRADVVKDLLVQGVNPNDEWRDSTMTALLWAIEGDSTEIVRLLLDKEANPEYRPQGFERTPLMAAAWRGNVEMCDMLMTHGADINQRGNNGATPMMMAVCGNDLDDCNLDVAVFLVEKGADVLMQNNEGASALSYVEEDSVFGQAIMTAFEEQKKQAAVKAAMEAAAEARRKEDIAQRAVATTRQETLRARSPKLKIRGMAP
jgi:ankyrin repeat protein